MSALKEAAGKGRFGDDMLLHVSRDELSGLNALARDMYGHNLTTNPDTGLPEAFLFAPLLAPMLASSVPALAGMGAVGTGLMAGGLGALEASARGMDDPLGQGLVAGLTGGAMAGIGNALATPGLEAMNAAGSSAADAAATQGMTAATTGGSAAAPSVAAGSGVTPELAGGAMSGADLAGAGQGALTLEGANGVTSGMAGNYQPVTLNNATFPQRMEAMQSGFGEITSNPETMGEFVSDATIPAAAGAAGLMYQSDMEYDAEQKAEKEKYEKEKAAEEQKAWDMIAGSYQRAGRELPVGASGKPRYPMAAGGLVGLNSYMCGGKVKGKKLASGGYLDGASDGMDDAVPAAIDEEQPAALSDGEFVIPADVVSHLGNGNSDAGAQVLYDMIAKIREDRTGSTDQAPRIKPRDYVPA